MWKFAIFVAIFAFGEFVEFFRFIVVPIYFNLIVYEGSFTKQYEVKFQCNMCRQQKDNVLTKKNT